MAKPSQTAGEEHANGSSSSVPAPAALPQSPTQPKTKRKHTDTDNGPNTSALSQQKMTKVKDAMDTGETNPLGHADAQSPADETPNGTPSGSVAEFPATHTAAGKSKADDHTDNEEEQEMENEPVATEAAAETKAQSQGKIKGKNKRRSKRRSKSNEYAVESVLAVRRAADWAKDKPQYQVAVKWEGYADPTWNRLETLDNDRLVLELLFSEQVTEQPGMVKTRVCAAQPDEEEEGAKATGV